MNDLTNKRRVVITGLGAVSPLGLTVADLWDGLLSGRSGVRRITLFDSTDLPCQIGGEVPDFNPGNYMDKKEARRIPRSSQLAVAAASEAIRDAGLPEVMPDPEKVGIVYGTAIGGADRIDEGVRVLLNGGYSRINPFILPSAVPNMPAFMIAKQFQCLGPSRTVTTACATGTQAVGEAAEMIQRGKVDMVITGGTEGMMVEITFAGFCAMRALPVNYNDNPEKASRPFDAKREGFIMSEGAAVLILESLEHAQQRGAHIYAEVLGHASACEGFHMAAPNPDALGPTRAIRWALEDACVSPEEVDYFNSHGTSTPLNDMIETQAIKNVFGEHAYKLAINSTKSMLGHPMGAAGALEAVVCALTLKNGIIHPTINYENPDPECDLDYVPNQARKQAVNIAISNSIGLGGQNACLVMKHFSDSITKSNT